MFYKSIIIWSSVALSIKSSFHAGSTPPSFIFKLSLKSLIGRLSKTLKSSRGELPSKMAATGKIFSREIVERVSVFTKKKKKTKAPSQQICLRSPKRVLKCGFFQN